MNLKEFNEMLSTINIKIDQNIFDKFYNYYKFLVEENKKYNLTSISEEDAVFEKHFFDSLSCNLFNLDGKILDVGSGGGFPSMPIKIINPDLDLTILDSNNKKIEFNKKLANLLNLDVKFINDRIENINFKYDFVLARGVASLNVLLELTCNVVKLNGYLIALKGPSYLEEITQSKNALNILGYKIEEIKEIHLINDNSNHYLLKIKKIKEHSSIYPRNYAKIKSKSL